MSPDTGTTVDPEPAGPTAPAPPPDSIAPPDCAGAIDVGTVTTGRRRAPRRRFRTARSRTPAAPPGAGPGHRHRHRHRPGHLPLLRPGYPVQPLVRDPHRIRARWCRSGAVPPASPSPRSPGGPRSISTLSGVKVHHPVVLNFFASWCTPCQKETPLLAKTADAERAKGSRVQFIGVDVADQPSDAIPFVHRTGITYPVANDADLRVTSGLYGLNGEPNTFFIAADGQRHRPCHRRRHRPGTAVLDPPARFLTGRASDRDPPRHEPVSLRANRVTPSALSLPAEQGGSHRRCQPPPRPPARSSRGPRRPCSTPGRGGGRRPGRRPEALWTPRPASRAASRGG